MTIIDIIILSLASNPTLRRTTEHGLETLLKSEQDNPEIEFRVLVIESNPEAAPYTGRNVQTLYPTVPFGYHTYMNLGIQGTSAPYVCLCNNDLVFHPGWATALLQAFEHDPTLSSASPVCSIHHPGVGIQPDSGTYTGYGIRREVAGWCLFFRRSMLDITGPLDERFKFWFADNDYAMTLQKHGLRHALISRSIVDHVESKTLLSRTRVQQRLLTRRAKIEYQKKWGEIGTLTYYRKLFSFHLKLSMLMIKESLNK
jgi:GT2 family glycosyltransferase